MAAIILAGGENRRMGANKAFLEHRGRLFLWSLIAALNPVFPDMILVTREPEQYAGFPVRPVRDLYTIRGPLTGIISGLCASGDRYNFCVACDMPFVRTGLVQHLMQAARGWEGAVPVLQGQSPAGGPMLEPLHAVYDRRSLPAMKRYLLGGGRSLQHMIRSLNVRYMPERELSGFDGGMTSLYNINTPRDYRALQKSTA
jgi:molybdopterin-guanine dinucleotide biosynthesis protein A